MPTQESATSGGERAFPMTETKIRITVPDIATVSGIRTPPEGANAGWLFLYAPGAGSNLHDPFGRFACRRLAAKGVTAVRFQFPYMEEGRRRPDRTAAVEATWLAATEAARESGSKLVVGGRSFSGRIVSQVVAQGIEVDALALFAYPLHPPGRQDQLRDSHFASIDVLTFFCSGTRDAFASPAELRTAAIQVKRSAVHLLEGADHGFGVRKADGRTKEDVWGEATDALVTWFNKVR